MNTLGALLITALMAQGEGAKPRAQDPTVLKALLWLARHQNTDGSWSVEDFSKTGRACSCKPNPGRGEHRAGVTALALLAFLCAGYSSESDDVYEGHSFFVLIRNAAAYLWEHQDQNGALGDTRADKYMYGHLIAAYALVKAYASGLENAKVPAQKALEFALSARSESGAWRYTAMSKDSDTSVTGWALLGLHAAQSAGFKVPSTHVKGALEWIDSVTENQYFRVGYTHKGTGKVYVPGMNEQFNHHESLTAIGITVRCLLGRKKDSEAVIGGVRLIMKDLPEWDGNAIDYYYWHHATVALHTRQGEDWKTWQRHLKPLLAEHPSKKGCALGSWEPTDRWGCEGGRVYATALNAITMCYLLDKPFVTSKAAPPEKKADTAKYLLKYKNGNSRPIVSYTKEGGKYVIVLPTGGTMSLDESLVEKIEEIKGP